ncbi:PEP/pyruvate-binding domain-containing protein [Actinomadura miaoliensis]|uniref:Phosphoenolpyruvate synthase n=1 Tax=Actinomadura miaoliensis TaxID=430685 RepID=A0ABP7W7V6_9ACTN
MLTLREAAASPTSGGKAHVLGRLQVAGVPVPDGLVLLPDEVARIAAEDGGELCERLARWATEHAPHGLVMRSSAAGEDGQHASFAGLFASRFTPAVPERIAEAVSEVHDSLHSPTVQDYAAALGVEPPARMAVLVHTAVRAACSGVLFTRWSMDSWRIETTLGLATLLVAGDCAPDVIEPGPADGETVEQIAEKYAAALPAARGELDMPPGEWIDWPGGGRAKLVFSGDGLIYARPPRELINAPALDPHGRKALLALADRAHTVLGAGPLDIEWARDGDGNLWLVQARPATRSPDTPRDDARQPAPQSARPDGAPMVLAGQGASPGTATASATVIMDAEQAERMRDGDILVSGPARPELVPALLRASGIACADVGLLCHTAIVARELGKPCVTGLLTAPETVIDGQLVTVDGDAGTLTLHPDGGTTAPQLPEPPSQHRRTPEGLQVVTQPPASPSDTPVVLALDHQTRALLDEQPLDTLISVGVAAVLLPAGTTPPRRLVDLGARLTMLSDGIGLLWLTQPPPEWATQPPLVWAGLPGGPLTSRTSAEGDSPR